MIANSQNWPFPQGHWWAHWGKQVSRWPIIFFFLFPSRQLPVHLPSYGTFPFSSPLLPLPLGLHSLKGDISWLMFTPFSPSHTHALSTQASTLLTHLLHSLTPSSHTHTHTQAFIHPGLARFFWSSARSDPYGLTLSPYEYCNGTFTAAQNHSFSFHQSDNLGEFVFIDFAGSGLVHLCGKMCSVMSLYNSFTTAGIVVLYSRGCREGWTLCEWYNRTDCHRGP